MACAHSYPTVSPIVVSSGPHLSPYYNHYSNDVNEAGEHIYNAQQNIFIPVSSTVTLQTNDCEFENSNFNFLWNSNFFNTESSSSIQLNESALVNNCSINNDATYFLSLPNNREWTVSPCLNRQSPSSPVSSTYADSRSSPMMSEMSFYDDIQTFQTLDGGRRTPPPPYRPPVNNIEMSPENLMFETLSLKHTKPPPPYTKTYNISATKCETITLSGFSEDTGTSVNSTLTAERSAVATSSDRRMLPLQDECYTGGFRKDETKTEMRVPAESDFSSKYSEENSVEKNGQKPFFEVVKQIIGNSVKNKQSTTSGGGQIQLWQFLLELLADQKNSSLIAWENKEGTFRFHDPEGIARLWGQRKIKDNCQKCPTKNKKPMNYDKLSRSLRHYYLKGIIQKVSNRKYTYQFLLDGVLNACSPSGVSDSMFICPNFNAYTCDKNSPRNFNLNVK